MKRAIFKADPPFGRVPMMRRFTGRMADHHFTASSGRVNLLPDHAGIAALDILSGRRTSPIREHAPLLTPSHDKPPTNGASLVGEPRDLLSPLWGRPSFVHSAIRATAALRDSSLNHFART